MQNFININRISLKKRDQNERVEDFKEIYSLFTKDEACEQSSRCVQCGNPFCHSACPLHNFIPHWLLNVAKRDFKTAFELSNSSNPFPEITGRICPQERLCEGACTLRDEFGAITIGAVETFITEEGLKRGFDPIKTGAFGDKKVAIVGCGPAGIAAATRLLKAGVNVSVFDEANRGGGLLTYGIPGFKLEKQIVQRRLNLLIERGLNLVSGTKVGRDISFDQLCDEFDAVFIAIGAREQRVANVVNEGAKGCFMALDFLIQTQMQIFKEIEQTNTLAGKKVVVVGGGDTAMDCLRTSLRLGCASSVCLYRRPKADMGGSKKEFLNAAQEGAEFIFSSAVKEIITNENGEVLGLMAQKTIINQGKVECIKASEFKVEADVIIFALGFDVQKCEFLSENGIETDRWGKILVDGDFQTSRVGVYAAGDCVSGSSLVVSAAADAKSAAEAILSSFS